MSKEYTFVLPPHLQIGVVSSHDFPIDERQAMLLGAYLPEVKIREGRPWFPDYMVYHEESPERQVVQSDPELHIKDTWRQQFPSDLPHLLYGIARSVWLQCGVFPVHAACVGDGDSYTLLPGHSGAGKSTVALELASQYDQKIFSGNTTLVRFDDNARLHAIAGTLTMTLRSEDFERRAYEAGPSVTYGDRSAFYLQREAYTAEAAVQIGKVALMRLNSDKQSWGQLSELSALHTLYPYLLDMVHADTLLATGKGMFVGATPVAVRRNLREQLREALGHMPVYSGAGGKTFISKKVLES